MFSSYKTYGPHQGIMVVRRQLAELLPNQAHSFNGGSLYKKFTPAGPDHAQVAACAGMVDYFDAVAANHGGADLSAPDRGALVHTLSTPRQSSVHCQSQETRHQTPETARHP